MKSSFCIDLQRFMLIPTKFPLNRKYSQVKPNFNPSVLIIRGYNIENELFTHQHKIEIVNSSLNSFLDIVIPLGFEPKTHSLEGCCSNPTELRNHLMSISANSGCKITHFL